MCLLVRFRMGVIPFAFLFSHTHTATRGYILFIRITAVVVCALAVHFATHNSQLLLTAWSFNWNRLASSHRERHTTTWGHSFTIPHCLPKAQFITKHKAVCRFISLHSDALLHCGCVVCLWRLAISICMYWFWVLDGVLHFLLSKTVRFCTHYITFSYLLHMFAQACGNFIIDSGPILLQYYKRQILVPFI